MSFSPFLRGLGARFGRVGAVSRTRTYNDAPRGVYMLRAQFARLAYRLATAYRRTNCDRTLLSAYFNSLVTASQLSICSWTSRFASTLHPVTDHAKDAQGEDYPQGRQGARPAPQEGYVPCHPDMNMSVSS